MAWVDARSTLAGALAGHEPDEAERILLENLRFDDRDVALGKTNTHLGFLYASKRRWHEAAQHFRHALDHRQKTLATMPMMPSIHGEVGLTWQRLAGVLAPNQQLADAEEYQRQAIPVFVRLARDYPAGPHYRLDLAAAHCEHAGLLKQLGK